MLRKRKKSRVNLAVILMIFTSICLSTIQVGFSFLSQAVFVSGSASFSVGETEGGALSIVEKANVITKVDNVHTGVGYTEVIKANVGTDLNNYIKFGKNATEKWRIVGWTSSGIKIVKDELETVVSSTVWDTGKSYWVPVAGVNLPYTATITSLEGCSTLCRYLNTSYYEQLTDATNVNYVNPEFINHSPIWDITPMYASGGSNKIEFPNNVASGQLRCTAETSNTFKGLPIGLMSMEEFCLVSTDSMQTGEYYTAFTSGWLKFQTGQQEISLTENYNNSGLSKMPSNISGICVMTDESPNYIMRLNKSATVGCYYRPAMYLKSNIQLSAPAGNSTAGSSTNPFIVTGVA